MTKQLERIAIVEEQLKGIKRMLNAIAVLLAGHIGIPFIPMVAAW